MKDRRRNILYGTLIAFAIALVVVVAYLSRTPTAVPQSATQAPPTPAQLKVGQQAPDFSAATTAGPFSLSAARGKPVLLEVFATWCPHCQRETTVLNSLFDAYHDRVDIVAVSGSDRGMDGNVAASQEDVVTFAQQFHLKYPVAYDPDLTVSRLYLQNGFPTIVVIGKNGTIRYFNSGEIPQAQLEKQLDAATR